MLGQGDLTPAERALCVAAAGGRLLDLRSRCPGDDDPARGATWPTERRIRATLLRQLVTGQGDLDQTFGPPLTVRVRGALVVGRLNLGGLTLRCAFELYDCYLGGRVELAKAVGVDVSLRGSHLAQRLSARQLRLRNNLNLTDGRCHGGINLCLAHIDGNLEAEHATLSRPGGTALNADGIRVDGTVYLTRARVTGEVRVPDARVGAFVCSDAEFANTGGTALFADAMQVHNDLFLDQVRVQGEVALIDTRISGRLDSRDASFANTGGVALDADGLRVGGAALLDGIRVDGALRLSHAHVGERLECSNAVLVNPGGLAFDAQRMAVQGGVVLAGTTAEGELLLSNAHVGAGLTLTGAVLTNPGGYVLLGDRLTVDGDLLLNGIRTEGEVSFNGARIDGQIECTGSELRNPAGQALTLTATSVAEIVLMHPASLDGGVDLRGARVAAWYDDRSTWPRVLFLKGFVYGAIDAPYTTARQRLDWLSRDAEGYLPQPYEQLATVYRREGHEQAVRAVSVAKQKARRAQHPQWWIRWPSRTWSLFLRWTIGYGYRPTLVLPHLAALLTVGWIVFDRAYPDHLHPVRSGAGQPSFNAARYSLDLLLPVANLKQRDAFTPEGYAAWWSFGLTLAGWLLAAVLVTGLSGVFKRD